MGIKKKLARLDLTRRVNARHRADARTLPTEAQLEARHSELKQLIWLAQPVTIGGE